MEQIKRDLYYVYFLYYVTRASWFCICQLKDCNIMAKTLCCITVYIYMCTLPVWAIHKACSKLLRLWILMSSVYNVNPWHNITPKESQTTAPQKPHLKNFTFKLTYMWKTSKPFEWQRAFVFCIKHHPAVI